MDTANPSIIASLAALLLAFSSLLAAAPAESPEVSPSEPGLFATDSDLANAAEGVVLDGAGYDTSYVFSALDEEDGVNYQDSLRDFYIRPGLMSPSDDLVPFRAAQRLARGFRMHAETGFGYDSNTLLNNGGYVSPTHPNLARRGGTVSWLRINVGYSDGVDGGDGRKFYYGFDLGGDIISYDRGGTAYGRSSAEPYIAPYVGFRTGKTNVRLGSSYYLKEGNYLFNWDTPREAPVAESQTYGVNLHVSHQLDHGTVAYAYDFRWVDFESGTRLNDQDSGIHDLSYLHNPPSMPKTGIGAGLRWGSYDTATNPDSDFFEPSLRVSHQTTAKTSFDGRVGYSFRDYDGPGAISSDGRMTYALGVNWQASQRVSLRAEIYRDFTPSYVSRAENFDTDGIQFRANYASPFWNLHFQTHFAYEQAEYYSTVVGGNSNRSDDYFRFGASVSRPLNLVRWLDTSVSIFYDYAENDSTHFQGDYDRHFTGIRLSGSL